MIITEINSQKIESIKDFTNAMEQFSNLTENQTAKLQIRTKDIEIINLFSKEVIEDFFVTKIPKTRIQMGLDLQGGARALVSGENVKLTDSQLDDLISVSQQRLNVYGLTDVQIRKVSDLSGNNFMLVEIAGSSPQDLEELIAKQGKFEARIQNKTTAKNV